MILSTLDPSPYDFIFEIFEKISYQLDSLSLYKFMNLSISNRCKTSDTQPTLYISPFSHICLQNVLNRKARPHKKCCIRTTAARSLLSQAIDVIQKSCWGNDRLLLIIKFHNHYPCVCVIWRSLGTSSTN